jgi:FkbH-like protein
MWQTDWAEGARLTQHAEWEAISELAPSAVDSVYLLHWVEHCTECAVPECYKSCPLYMPRRDRKCARFKKGIFPNPQYSGLFPYGAEIQFRRWGKLESTFGFGAVTPARAQWLDRVDRALLRGVGATSSMMRGISPNYRLNGGYSVLREQFLRFVARPRREEFDDFIVEVWNLGSEPVCLVIECWQDGLKFRTSVTVEPGKAMHRLPASSMNIDLYGRFGVVRVFPDHDVEAHIVFSWLDFVRYGRTGRGCHESVPAEAGATSAPDAPKVKCVIWDLDNTVWDGILGEQDPRQVSLRPRVHKTMLTLDEVGILQSISSKNDHDDAWAVLQRLGVAHLFLCPKINWQPKSANIRAIVDSLNIGVDACAFIDDSIFEREEVRSQFPTIRTYSDADISNLIDRPEFDVPVTTESRQRRLSYLSELSRKEQAIQYGDNYEGFLRRCRMHADLFAPSEPLHVDRCLELLHRSNQLNLSTHRYTRPEFERLLGSGRVVPICTACHDRFGNYGLIGFAALEQEGTALFLKDFVLSCRVAQKKLENAWFRWLLSAASAAGYSKIHARYVKTPRNVVLLDVLKEVGFTEAEISSEGSLLEVSCATLPPGSDIVSIDSTAVKDLPLPLQAETRAV